jgi:hypothetical protein
MLLALLHSLIFAKTDLDYDPDVLIAILMNSFEKQDRRLLEQQLVR